jgi:hypothetical protein
VPPLGSTFGLVEDFHYGRAFTELIRLEGFPGNASNTHKIGGQYIERPVAVYFKLQAVGGAGVRYASVEFQDEQGINFARVLSSFTVAAGNTSEFTFAVGSSAAGANNLAAILDALPELFLQPGYGVRLSAVGGLAADTATHVAIMVERFSTSPRDFPPGQGVELPQREWLRDQLAGVSREG